VVVPLSQYAMQLANADGPDAVVSDLESIIADESINMETPCTVYIAKDTRESSEVGVWRCHRRFGWFVPTHSCHSTPLLTCSAWPVTCVLVLKQLGRKWWTLGC